MPEELTRDDFVIDAVNYQGKVRYSLQSKYQSFKREDIVHIIDMIMRAQNLNHLKEMVDAIEIDKVEKQAIDANFNIQEIFSTIRTLKKEI